MFPDVEQLVQACALLKRNVMAAPFEVAFNFQAQGQQSPLMRINYRDNEAIFIKANPDRVTVIFSTEFKDDTDQIYGRVFLQVKYL
jgi:actin related protein 2/3 complex subunit 2